MSDIINDGGPAFPHDLEKHKIGSRICALCSEFSCVKQGHQWLCEKHYRIGQMRANAKRNRKFVPAACDIDYLVSLCGMVCPSCGRKMNWLAKHGHSTVVTLQHDRDGGIRTICLSCNTRHQHYDGDSFYSRNPDFHVCKDCLRLLPKSDFNIDRGRPLGIKSYCKECSHKRHILWVTKNRERYNEYQRTRRSIRRSAQYFSAV